MPMESLRLCSVQVGTPRPLGDDEDGRPVESAFAKAPVVGPVWLGLTNLTGDEQADQRHHGGPDKAVLAYGAAHYPDWRVELNRPDFPYGAFGENFTIDGLTEQTVYLGDIYAIGGARLEVAQPRIPCWKISRRWGMADLTGRVERSLRTGWYLRVLQEGTVEAGQPVTLLERPHPQWPIRRVQEVFRQSRKDGAAGLALAACPALAAVLREILLKRAGRA